MTPQLSPRTRKLVEIIFKPKDAAEAAQWLEEECGNNLPFCEGQDEYGMERIRFAAIRLSKGKMRELLRAIDAARMDWRDLLMAAGFGFEVQAHETWAKEILGK